MRKIEAIILTGIFSIITFPFFFCFGLFLTAVDVIFLIVEIFTDETEWEHALFSKTIFKWIGYCKNTYDKIIDD